MSINYQMWGLLRASPSGHVQVKLLITKMRAEVFLRSPQGCGLFKSAKDAHAIKDAINDRVTALRAMQGKAANRA